MKHRRESFSLEERARHVAASSAFEGSLVQYLAFLQEKKKEGEHPGRIPKLETLKHWRTAGVKETIQKGE